ncbi:MAG TPA: hypothetical protein VFH50_08400 [Acidimicrobiales bacterium]|nr:hypothetical protein [Acidimicrobiales bacterium]
MSGPEDPGVVEALGHLQTAFLELIAAARVSLDAIERAVRAVPPPAGEAGESRARTDPTPGPPGVEHIRVS